jgi:iron(III) transport system permease protein
VTATRDVIVPGPAPAGPGTPRWRRVAAPRGLTALLGRLGLPLFWTALILFILVPCASSLALALSPRLFSQGTQWFTLHYLGQAFTGATAIAITNSLW